MGVWIELGVMQLHFFRALKLNKIRGLKRGRSSSFCGDSGIFLQMSASENVFGKGRAIIKGILGIFKGGDLNPGERHSRDTRDDGMVTLCTLRAATVLSRDCRADFGRPLTKKVMSHSRDGPGVTAPSRTNIVPLTGVWNPPLSVNPLKVPENISPERENHPFNGKFTYFSQICLTRCFARGRANHEVHIVN